MLLLLAGEGMYFVSQALICAEGWWRAIELILEVTEALRALPALARAGEVTRDQKNAYIVTRISSFPHKIDLILTSWICCATLWE
jgi:hypothetical protein